MHLRLFLLICSLTLSSCGQYGKLYLPEKSTPTEEKALKTVYER